MSSTEGRIAVGGAGAVIVLLLVSACTTAPWEFSSATLHGVVHDELSRPVALAEIVREGARPVHTDAQGRFALPRVSRGELTVRASARGYAETEAKVVFANRSQLLYLRLLSAEYYRRRAETALEAGDLSRARAELDAGQRAAPEDPELRYLSVIVSVLEGDPERALGELGWFARIPGLAAVTSLREGLEASR